MLGQWRVGGVSLWVVNHLAFIPLPSAGFSTSSTFFNMHYLMACSKKNSLDPKTRISFPWVLWHMWKNRNIHCFEHRSTDAVTLITGAMEEASVWLQLHSFIPPGAPAVEFKENTSTIWSKPPSGFVKCNVGSAWSPNTDCWCSLDYTKLVWPGYAP
ncbi:hypothetical protein Bca4012_060646 [Brassica carinata]|uniref:Uncharacterized protein n=1 Tax=Brassica carinata TaxID=52824 RepID=A0A8X7S788_BRACI|nr:hypothetical protein Bca52824_030984 [Brassica carinata]